jgi:deoxycytidylate deaminase
MVKTKIIKTTVWLVSQMSKEQYKVGAIYIEGWRYSVGYNKSAAYGDHAEDMAIKWFIRKYKRVPNNGTMYCTWSPCSQCDILLQKYNIKIWYVEKYLGKL